MADQTIVIALISGTASGLGVALINYFANRKKIAAETEKTKAETEKLRNDFKELSATVHNSLPEEIIFGIQEVSGFDVKGQGGQFWTGMGKESKPISARGEGVLSFKERGILNIERSNTEGRFEINLIRYLYNGNECSIIPKNELIPGKRIFRLSFEAKTLGGGHTLRGVVRNPKTGQRFDDNTYTITGNEWMQVKISLQIDPNEECQIRIDDEQVSKAPSSVQIRKLRVTEIKK